MEAEYLKVLTETESRSKSNTHRLDKLEEQTSAVNELAKSVAVMVQEQKHQTETMNGLKDDVSKLDSKVDALEAKPGKRWDKVVECALSAIVGAVIAYFLAGGSL